ncbi:hypothetical protein M406DRAFT_42625 [Cryphonectria parasitica EP155]|uniref:Calcineurin-like phosphoesterase domain-containing protein n=1 Tax=Cryphonectria parasitica (strain ATCC 38755 / EP155) TaxID=660469 RepID=A0A9P5CPG0_CRYP1|nr:uncharacterized protein M406DRAFT_42625 [Cryphonectria parasitica EP155]KAF3765126.1 hypothetical protein M406DRAFT_42625 [Cryphonectria parasitica EP155]
MLVDTLPEEFVPAVYSGEGTSADGGRGTARRLVIIGDVHGQTKALEDLLEKVQFNNTKGDHLIFTGDLINKGPDSAGVVAMAMRLGAHSVRGNHEDRVLLAHAAMNKKSPATAADALTAHQVAEAALSKGDQRDRETARSLSDEQIRWLAERPLILHIGPIPRGGGGGGNGQPPTFENMVVVHAGLVPNVSLEAQDPWAVMNMRTITLLKRRNKDEKKKEKKKAGKNKKGEESEPITTVVYGHDAKSGLQVPKEFGKGKRGYTFGLDSGCVYGKSLTALVIEVKDGAAVYEIVQVDCEAAAAVDAVAK